MSFTTKPYPYKRAIPPTSPESLLKYYQEELRKVELATTKLVAVLEELEARATLNGV